MVIGHEYVGEIAALGPGVRESYYKIGQRVSGEGHIVCGHCRNCRAGNAHCCKFTEGIGVDRNGAFAEYLCLPESNVIPIPDNIPDDIVSFFDAYGNATHSATLFDVVGEDVLITGAGPIGIIAAGICAHNGARRVVVTDVNSYRLDLAKKMGATATVDLRESTLEETMREQDIIEGFDVGLEMSGNGDALNQMLKSMRNGGKCALLGIVGSSSLIDWNDVIFKCLTLKGVYGRRMFETWYRMMAMVQSGLDLSPVITHRYSYAEFEKGFDAMNGGRSGKVILNWEKD
jgi:threonine 3-dehydrogenase